MLPIPSHLADIYATRATQSGELIDQSSELLSLRSSSRDSIAQPAVTKGIFLSR